MRVDSNDRARPAANGTGSHVISDGDDTSLRRCRRCGHPLHAAVSIRLGTGPICRRAEAAEVVAA
ncbi:DUF6011 domain-containing protein [Nocardioides caldifontis]|uniref:DUF6011 domain-containing protein n=1 Tax=Nocardioides caldifontis TaxID=2588938 RepID=UPI003B848948